MKFFNCICCVVLNGIMIIKDELERMLNEAVMVYFKILF
jgi:hypothetical protein